MGCKIGFLGYPWLNQLLVILCLLLSSCLFFVVELIVTRINKSNQIKELVDQRTETPTEEVDILRGVRQGCILSPMLFNVYTDRMIEEALQERRGIQINEESLTNIRYTDDTVLLAENEQELQEMLEAVNQACKRYGMA